MVNAAPTSNPPDSPLANVSERATEMAWTVALAVAFHCGCGTFSPGSPSQPFAPTLAALAGRKVSVRWEAQHSMPPVTAHAIKVRPVGSSEWKLYDAALCSFVASGGSAVAACDNALIVQVHGVTGSIEVILAAKNCCGWSEWSRPALISCVSAPRVALPVPRTVPTPMPLQQNQSMAMRAPPLRPSSTRRENWMVLYHATSWSNALNIIREQHFRTGTRGFIGPGIYFSSGKDSAFRYCQCRSGHGARVALRCRVNVGNIMRVRKGMVCTRAMLSANGCDSFEEANRDSFMLPDNDDFQIDMASVEIV